MQWVITRTDAFLYVVQIIGCYLYPMAMEGYILDRNLKHKPVGFFFKCLNLSSILTVISAVCQWSSMIRHVPRTVNSFKMITKIIIDIAVAILLFVDSIGLFVNMGFNIDAWLAAADMFVLLLSTIWEIAYKIFGDRLGTPQTSTPRELEDGDMVSNADEIVGKAHQIDLEGQQPTVENQSAISPWEMIFQSSYARIYTWSANLVVGPEDSNIFSRRLVEVSTKEKALESSSIGWNFY